MGLIAIIILSVTLGWSAFTGGLESFTGERGPIHHYWFENGRALKRFYEFEPPARKSVIVDITGMSYRTADGTQPTKRDRSRPFPRLDTSIPPIESANPPSAPVMVQSMPAPLGQGQIEEAPLPAQPPRAIVPREIVPPASTLAPEKEMSVGRKVQMVLKANNTLSRSASLTLKATTNLLNKNKVTLRGIVLDEEEKDYIGALAETVAGAGNVDNKLTIL